MEAIYEVICWGRPRDKSIHGLGFFKDKNLAELFCLHKQKELKGQWKFVSYREIKLMDESPEVIFCLHKWKFVSYREIKLMDESPELIKIILAPSK